jgi:mannose-6-phosphate isomerase
MRPLKFYPNLKRSQWGWRGLGDQLGKSLGVETDYAESWEISCHPNGLSVIEGEPHDGKTLVDLIEENPEKILGRHADKKCFPLLIKFLDANDRLSVQVHPNDEQAKKYRKGENGKTEAWVILGADAKSCVYSGLKQNVTPDQLRTAITNDNVELCLHSVPVAKADCLFIPAGTVHAIGEGVLVAEIQQSSDLTFRISDWGRVGTDGKPRELHLEQAFECINFSQGPVDPVKPVVEQNSATLKTETLVECEQFVIRRHTFSGQFSLKSDDCFRVMMNLGGDCELDSEGERIPLVSGESTLIPAENTGVDINPTGDPEVVLLESYLP